MAKINKSKTLDNRFLRNNIADKIDSYYFSPSRFPANEKGERVSKEIGKVIGFDNSKAELLECLEMDIACLKDMGIEEFLKRKKMGFK